METVEHHLVKKVSDTALNALAIILLVLFDLSEKAVENLLD